MMDGLKLDEEMERDSSRAQFTREQCEELAEVEVLPDESEAIAWDPVNERRRSVRVSCTTGE